MNRLVALVATLLASTAPAWADLDADANRLFVEAMQAWKQSEHLSIDNLDHAQERVDLLTTSYENLNRIISEHPSSNLAVQLLIGPVGPLNLDALPALITEAEIPLLGLRANKQLEMAQAHLLNGEIDEARVALHTAAIFSARQIEDMNQQSRALAFVATAEAEFGYIDRAYNAVALARRSVAKIDNESPFLRSWALESIAKALAESGDVVGTLRTADQIIEPTWRFAIPSYIVRAKFKAGDLHDAIETAKQFDDIKDRSRALAYLAIAQSDAGDITAALATSLQVENTTFRSSALASIANTQAMFNDTLGALKTVEIALEAAQKVNITKDRSWQLALIARAQANAGDLAGAYHTADQIGDVKNRSLALSSIAKAKARFGDIAGGFRTGKQIVDPFWRAGALAYIAHIQPKSTDTSLANEAANLAFQAVQKLKSNVVRFQALSHVAEAQAEAGDITSAVTTANDIDDAFWRSRAFIFIAGNIDTAADYR